MGRHFPYVLTKLSKNGVLPSRDISLVLGEVSRGDWARREEGQGAEGTGLSRTTLKYWGPYSSAG